jgi:cob(I)alamin adenosyltransferase
MKAKIYTKTGDKGTTRLADGSCVEKFNPRVEAYGTVDELNSYLGLVRAVLAKSSGAGSSQAEIPNSFNGFLEKVQNHLFNLGSLLACADADVFSKLPTVTEAQVVAIEQKIDELSSSLPELRNFILPGGTELASHLHIARTLCRRAERRSAEIMIQDQRYDVCLRYLNRLSDFLFVASRWINHHSGLADVVWSKSE